jgi:hypothetical protein
MKLPFPLAYYHTIYLIVKLFWINFMFHMAWKIVLSLLNLPLLLLCEFQTSLLLTKHYNKTNVVEHHKLWCLFLPPPF